MTRSASLARLGARLGAGLALAALAASALAEGVPRARAVDIARWSIPDATPAQRKATALKEARAALAENQRLCRQEARASRPGCLAQAQALHRADMANISRHGALLPARDLPRPSARETIVALDPQIYGSHGSSSAQAPQGLDSSGSDSAAPWERGRDSNLYEDLKNRGMDERDPSWREARSQERP